MNRGRLTVGNVQIHTARFSADCITWVQQSPGRYTSGHLYVYAKGMSIHGVVHQGTSRADAVRHDFIGTTVKPVTYKTAITRQAHPRIQDPSQIPASEWTDGLDLVIAYEIKMGGTVPEPVVSLGGQDITGCTTWSVAANGSTVLVIKLDDGALVAPEFYTAAIRISRPRRALAPSLRPAPACCRFPACTSGKPPRSRHRRSWFRRWPSSRSHPTI